jgi:hypothetical protein
VVQEEGMVEVEEECLLSTIKIITLVNSCLWVVLLAVVLYAINVNIILLLKTKEYIYTVIKQFTNIINKLLIVEDPTVTVK